MLITTYYKNNPKKLIIISLFINMALLIAKPIIKLMIIFIKQKYNKFTKLFDIIK